MWCEQFPWLTPSVVPWSLVMLVGGQISVGAHVENAHCALTLMLLLCGWYFWIFCHVDFNFHLWHLWLVCGFCNHMIHSKHDTAYPLSCVWLFICLHVCVGAYVKWVLMLSRMCYQYNFNIFTGFNSCLNSFRIIGIKIQRWLFKIVKKPENLVWGPGFPCGILGQRL